MFNKSSFDTGSDNPALSQDLPANPRLRRFSSFALNAPFAPDSDSSCGEHAVSAAPQTSYGIPEIAQREPKQPLYRRKWFIIAGIVSALLGIALLFVLLYPVAHAIIQHILNATALNVDEAIITNPTNGSFDLTLNAWVSHAGIFSATVAFTQPLSIAWVNSSGHQVHLGTTLLNPLTVKSKRAYINQTASLTIDDEDAFSQFTSAMITQQNFVWHLTSDNVNVRVMKLLTSHNLHFQKDVTLNGMGKFTDNISLVDLKLPADAPEGGIELGSVVGLHNPSPFSINLGTVVFSLSYQGLYLGTGSASNTTLSPGGNNITLQGRLVPQNGTGDLTRVSQLFTQFLNGESSDVIATGVSSIQDDGRPISWLSSALTSLQLHVPFKAPDAISPIKSVAIGDMALVFSEQDAWTPIATSKTLQAAMELPFGFNVSIGEISNVFNMTIGGNVVAGLSTPSSASTSDIRVFNSTCTQGTINITFEDTPLDVPVADRPFFSAFSRSLTTDTLLPFQLEGAARAIANTSIGQITLDPIKYSAPASLEGLQGLKQFTQIESVDVIGGSSEAIYLSINTTISNPSNVALSIGDLTLQTFRGDALVGTALLPNLTLQQGNNSLIAYSNFTPNASPEGAQTLNDFVGGTNVEIMISGYNQSTPIDSLLDALSSLNVTAKLPPLKTGFIHSAALEVLQTTDGRNNTAHATVTLVNPFTSDLAITNIQSNVTFRNITLGTIDTLTSISSKGKSVTTSPALDLSMNMAPEALFTVTRILAEGAGLPTAQLDAIVQLGGYQYLDDLKSADVSKRDNIFEGFNLPAYVDEAFAKLAADVQLSVGVNIGSYPTTLSYNQSNVPVQTDKSLNMLLPTLAQPIVQKIVSGAVLSIDTVLIKDVQENSFGTSLKGSITNAGPFDATISFPTGLVIEWNGNVLGRIGMADIDVIGNTGATFDVDTTFNVTDIDHLSNFTRVMLTEESFNWIVSGNNLSVSALGLSVPGIELAEKNVTLKGMNNLKNCISIGSFDLPGDDPAGGIHINLQANVTNPSQVGIALPSIGFQTFFDNTNIGPVLSTGTLTLSPSTTVPLSLSGRLVPQSSQAGLNAVSAVFNNFVHGNNSDIVVQGDVAGSADVTWLNEAIKSLQVETTLPSQGILSIMKSIDLNAITLLFSEAAPFEPLMTSEDTTVAFSLPFNFPVNIVAVEQNITVGSGGTDFAELVIPRGPSTTDVQNRLIHLNISQIPMQVFSGQHAAFEQFLSDIATATADSMSLKGSANADAETSVGLLSLRDIGFSLETSISGLQGLNAAPALVTNMDVYHGYPDYLLIKVNSSLFNPSNITLGAGNVSFDLSFQEDVIGQADLGDLSLVPGNRSYVIDVHYQPQGSAVASGQKLLENYLQGVISATAIQGTQDSTQIESLQPALADIRISPVNIPALHQNLVSSASLVFPTNIAQTGLGQVSFSLINPFTASINLLEVAANATFGNLTLGTINHIDLSSNPIHASGHANATSSTLPFELNLDPAAIIQLLLDSAQNNHVDLGPLPGLFQIALQNPVAPNQSKINATVQTGSPSCASGQQFDVTNAILDSLKGLEVTLEIDSSVNIDEFSTQLAFTQTGVNVVTDETVLYLIGVVAPPIVQQLANEAILNFEEANITNISDAGFDLSLMGSITGLGPLDAEIFFVEPVTVTWQDQKIAEIMLPSLCIAANSGVLSYGMKAQLTITNEDAFTTFATYLLHNPEFEWTISTDAVRITALGMAFDGVSFNKTVSFKGFDNLPGVSISDFKLPSDDPAGGIHIEADSVIQSPAQLGIDLGTVAFEASFNGMALGPLSGNNVFLAPQSTTNLQLSGRMTPKNGTDLDTMGELFTAYLQAKNQTLSIQCESVQPAGSNGTVGWLSAAFKTLTLDVVLPGQRLDVIQSVDMSDIELVMTDQSEAYAPLASSKNVLAQYKNPFGFSLQVIESSENLTLATQGVDFAELNLPQISANGGISTGNVVPLDLSFGNQTLRSLNDGAFSQFFATVTNTAGVELELKGSADIVGRTTIGDIPISGIPINVTTSLSGINAFGHSALLSNVSITGSGRDSNGPFITVPLTTTLNNPSNISLQTAGVELSPYYKDVMLGRAVIDSLSLFPGENLVSTEFQYAPSDANDTTVQAFLTEFLQTHDNISLTIKGGADSSPFASLVPALENVEISTSIKGLNVPPFVTHINAYITPQSLIDNLVSVDFDIANPFDIDVQILFAQVDSGINGVTYVHLDQAFNNFSIPAGSTTNSGTINNVLLSQGALGSVGVLSSSTIDLFSAVTIQIGEYTIPWLHLTVLGVPITYHL